MKTTHMGREIDASENLRGQDDYEILNAIVAELTKYEEQSKLLNELFTFLDYKEEGDSGKLWSPIQLSCARAMMVGPLDECLRKLKETIK